MMRSLLFILLGCSIVVPASAQLPTVAAGSIQRFDNFPSKWVDARKVDVWLPDGYSAQKKYAVLYMHDGNALFDSTIMWNHQEWSVDETITALMGEKAIRDVIVVGIWNNGAKRHIEYFPQQPFDQLTPANKALVSEQLLQKGRSAAVFRPISDQYLQFLVEELKPFIDSAFSTKKDRSNTFIAGSSMGGLISMYAICRYPQVFGGAACLSTHWPGTFTTDNNPVPAAFLQYLQEHLPSPTTHQLYFDYGDQTLDAMYPPLQRRVDSVMQAKGFDAAHWQTKFYPGENHSEQAWAKRLKVPLVFLLKE